MKVKKILESRFDQEYQMTETQTDSILHPLFLEKDNVFDAPACQTGAMKQESILCSGVGHRSTFADTSRSNCQSQAAIGYRGTVSRQNVRIGQSGVVPTLSGLVPLGAS